MDFQIITFGHQFFLSYVEVAGIVDKNALFKHENSDCTI